MKNCKNKTLKNKHNGNSYYPIKYAIHCKNKKKHSLIIEILQKIGFTIFNKETFGLDHTFLKPPKSFNLKNFYFVIVVKKGGNKQTVKLRNVQGPHIGFRINSKMLFNKIHKSICDLTKTIIIDKPDEYSLFIDLSCGEILEIALKK
jgi:hypothetical protein